MIIRILKNDLKRKKVMNIIILLFILISAVFMASSVNNIACSLNGLDYYFEKAEVPSYSVILRGGEENIEFEKNISNIENVMRGIFPNHLSVYLCEKDGKNHCVQTFKTARFIRYVNMGIEANRNNESK